MYKKIRDHLNVNVAAKVERLEIMAETVAELVESRENYQEAAKDLLHNFFTLNPGEIRNFDIGGTDILSPPSKQVTAAPTGQQLQMNHFGPNPPIPPQIQCNREQHPDADGEEMSNATPPPQQPTNDTDQGSQLPMQAQFMNNQSNANVSEQVQQGNDGTGQEAQSNPARGSGDRESGEGGSRSGGNDRRSDRDRHPRRNRTRANHPFASGEVYGCFITVRGRPNIAWTVSEYERLTRNGYNLVKTYPTFVQAQLWLRRRRRRYKELNPGAPDADWSSSSDEDDDSSGDGQNGTPPPLGPAQPPRAPPPPDRNNPRTNNLRMIRQGNRHLPANEMLKLRVEMKEHRVNQKVVVQINRINHLTRDRRTMMDGWIDARNGNAVNITRQKRRIVVLMQRRQRRHLKHLHIGLKNWILKIFSSFLWMQQERGPMVGCFMKTPMEREFH
jgi:hypothetical protein